VGGTRSLLGWTSPREKPVARGAHGRPPLALRRAHRPHAPSLMLPLPQSPPPPLSLGAAPLDTSELSVDGGCWSSELTTCSCSAASAQPPVGASASSPPPSALPPAATIPCGRADGFRGYVAVTEPPPPPPPPDAREVAGSVHSMALTHAWEGPNKAAVAFAAATVATASQSGDAQPPSAAQNLGGRGGRGGFAVDGPAAPVATAGVAPAARPPAAGSPPHPTRGRRGRAWRQTACGAAARCYCGRHGGSRRPPASPPLALSAPTQSSEMAGDHLGHRCAFDSSHNVKFLY